MRSLTSWIVVTCVTGALCLATVAPAQAPARGEAVVEAQQVSATVTKINHKTRQVTLKADDGEMYTFLVGDDVENLAQVKKGDVVTATYTEAIAYNVTKGGTATDATATVAAGAAALGEKPAAAIAGQVSLTVTITAIDYDVPSVTFTGPGGETRTIRVNYPEKLEGVDVGDTVELNYTEAIVLKVDKPAKK